MKPTSAAAQREARPDRQVEPHESVVLAPRRTRQPTKAAERRGDRSAPRQPTKASRLHPGVVGEARQRAERPEQGRRAEHDEETGQRAVSPAVIGGWPAFAADSPAVVSMTAPPSIARWSRREWAPGHGSADGRSSAETRSARSGALGGAIRRRPDGRQFASASRQADRRERDPDLAEDLDRDEEAERTGRARRGTCRPGTARSRRSG